MNAKHFALATLATLTSVASHAAIGSLGGSADARSFVALSAANVYGGALLDVGISGVAAMPADTVGLYLSTGPGNTNNGGGDATFLAGRGVSAVSFEWGTPDWYNTLYVTQSNGAVSSFTASSLSLGGQGYVTVTADAGTRLRALTFDSARYNAFEASNFSITSAVPEPASVAMLLAGMGLVGFSARKRLPWVPAADASATAR